MLKSKAIDILKTLTQDEFRRFKFFIKSPYFNSNQSIIRLVNELKTYYPDFTSEMMSEESVYAKVYGKGKFSYSVMKNLMSELILICDKFLVNERFNKDFMLKSKNTIILLEEYRERKLNNLFSIRSKKFEEEFKNIKIDNNEYFMIAAAFEILKYRDLLNNHRHDKLIWNGFMNRASFELCRVFQLLYTSSDIIIHSSELLKGDAQKSIMNKFVRRLNLEDFIKDFDPEENEEYFFLYIYSRLILLTINKEKDTCENYFFEIKSTLIKKLNRFSNEHIYDILKSLRSYAMSRMKAGNALFIDELFDVDKLLIEKVDYSSGSIKWFIGEIFSEIIMLSLHKKDNKYAERFIIKFRDQLNDDVREYEIGWANALICLESGNIEKSIELLSKIKPSNTVAKISIKNLYLRAYYDLGYDEEALSIIDSYRHFINNDKNFSEIKKKNLNAHLSIFVRLYRIKQNPGKYSGLDLKKLNNDINRIYFLAGKDWYFKKVNELGKLVN